MHSSRLVLILLLLFVTVAITEASAKVRKISSGQWGARGIRLVVENNSGTVEFDCAHGTISGPLYVNGNGKFSFSGTYVKERGGPVRMGDSDKGEPAEYSGWTDGKKMTLKVKLKGAKELLGTYSLVRGQEGRLFICL